VDNPTPLIYFYNWYIATIQNQINTLVFLVV